MSKTKLFSNNNIVFIVIIVIIIIGLCWYKMNTKENFDGSGSDIINSKIAGSKELQNALKLMTSIELPDNVGNAMSSVPTLIKKLSFSGVKESFYGQMSGNTFADANSVTNASKWDSKNLTYDSSSKKNKNGVCRWVKV